MSSSAETCLWLIRHVARLMTRFNSARDGCSPFRRIFGKPYDGSICKFGEQVHYKLSGRLLSSVEPRWELGARVGKMGLTDDHLLGTFARIRSSRTKESLLQQRSLGSHCGHTHKPQARQCGQGSTGQETVHHVEMG